MNAGEHMEIGCENCSCVNGRLDCVSHLGCQLDGGWGSWSTWTPCSEPCGGGSQHRVRECDSPSPRDGGRGCRGSPDQRRECNKKPCEGWSSWTEWSTCSKSCGAGFEFRNRSCDSDLPALCVGNFEETRSCNGTCAAWLVWSKWSPWSTCSVSCGGGEQLRVRDCLNPPCEGFSTQTKTCQSQVCLAVLGILHGEAVPEQREGKPKTQSSTMGNLSPAAAEMAFIQLSAGVQQTRGLEQSETVVRPGPDAGG
ncbi:semaphorin-5A-like [Chiloscyllium plagiosum]|uniref:semaphorin-5A-like n=1 Tax=Chiloscyllium plagiosum TaxID=36176 RepID=UPI001CB85091|nr:semaphorin-5A-like [Chiloscyllium plagiosum]